MLENLFSRQVLPTVFAAHPEISGTGLITQTGPFDVTGITSVASVAVGFRYNPTTSFTAASSAKSPPISASHLWGAETPSEAQAVRRSSDGGARAAVTKP